MQKSSNFITINENPSNFQLNFKSLKPTVPSLKVPAANPPRVGPLRLFTVSYLTKVPEEENQVENIEIN